MATNLAYYPLSRKTADPIGNLAPQSLQVINCRFDASQSYVNPSPGAQVATPYPNTGTNVDYGIREGEIVFTFRGSLGFDQPHVRACLNNITIDALNDDMALAKIRDSIVIVGFSTKTCSVNSTNINHTEAPVAANSGHITILNVSNYTTVPGDVLIWCLPNRTERGSQTPVDGSSAMSPMRRVIEPVPLRILMSPFMERAHGRGIIEDQRKHSQMLISNNEMIELSMQTAFKTFLKRIIAHYRTYEAAGVPLNDYRIDIHERGSQNGIPNNIYRNQVAFNNVFEDNAFDARLSDFITCMYKDNRQDNKPSALIEDIFCHMLPLVATVENMIMSRRVAHVTRGSVPGKRQDISIQLGPSSVTKRLYGGF